jgi:hypothetical protein
VALSEVVRFSEEHNMPILGNDSIIDGVV